MTNDAKIFLSNRENGEARNSGDFLKVSSDDAWKIPRFSKWKTYANLPILQESFSTRKIHSPLSSFFSLTKCSRFFNAIWPCLKSHEWQFSRIIYGFTPISRGFSFWGQKLDTNEFPVLRRVKEKALKESKIDDLRFFSNVTSSSETKINRA